MEYGGEEEQAGLCLSLYLVVDLEHKTGGVGGEEEQDGLHLSLYLVVDLEHKTGGVGGEEEEAGVQGYAGDGVLQPSNLHYLLASSQQ